ncbi:hypothetical protein H7169_01715 [Candidatus Gracilibacteria bacterium]|nr:hypothetical protein [Candidatus Gracilibacteria bacterium]
MNAIDHPDLITQIHPINATHLLSTQPHRVFGDVGGNLLEIVVERFARTVDETLYGHGGIIALAYHDAMTDGERSFENTYLIGHDGQIRGLHSHFGELPIGIDLDIFYMLLNPVEINNWILQDIRAIENIGATEDDRISFGNYGLGIDIPVGVMRPKLREVILHARDRYLRSLDR